MIISKEQIAYYEKSWGKLLPLKLKVWLCNYPILKGENVQFVYYFIKKTIGFLLMSNDIFFFQRFYNITNFITYWITSSAILFFIWNHHFYYTTNYNMPTFQLWKIRDLDESYLKNILPRLPKKNTVLDDNRLI